jgi:phage baseplate assembly protein W
MAVQRISRSFKDISLSFDMHPITKDITVLKDEDAVKRSIRNIVQTLPFERFFNPTFGSDVRTNLFDFVDFGSATVLEEQINIAIRNDEPRANNITVEVLPKTDINSFEINVYFSIVGLELPQQKFTYILESSR